MPHYNWFTEGFDTLDLKKAKALLEELGPTAGKQPHGLFLKIAASRFPVLHAAAQHVALPEG